MVESISRKKTNPLGNAEPAKTGAGRIVVSKTKPAAMIVLNGLTRRFPATRLAGIDVKIRKGVRGGVIAPPSGRTEERLTEFLHRCRDSAADDVLAFRRAHLELFVPVDDRP